MNWLHPQSRVFSAKLLVPLLFKKIPVLNGTQKFIALFKVGYPFVFQINDYLITLDATKDVTV